MRFKTAILIFPLCASLCGATVEVKTLPAGDGVLIDTNNDGIVDQVIAVDTDGDCREAVSGKVRNKNSKALFEFKLPQLSAAPKKAVLKLHLNGKYGCSPDKPDAHGPLTDIYYYLAPEADGKIDLVDDNGVKLGVAMEAKPVNFIEGKPLAPVLIDVTEALKAALKAGSPWLGFRLEAAPGEPSGIGWRWRTAEFAAKSGKQYNPTLIITTE